MTHDPQGILETVIRATGRCVGVKGVHPRHFSFGFSLTTWRPEQALRICTATIQGESQDQSTGLPSFPLSFLAEFRVVLMNGSPCRASLQEFALAKTLPDESTDFARVSLADNLRVKSW